MSGIAAEPLKICQALGLPCDVGPPLVPVTGEGPAFHSSGTEQFGQHPTLNSS